MKLYDPTYAHLERNVKRADTRNGITRLALDFSTTMPAVRWFTVAELRKANTAVAIEEILSAGAWNEAYREIMDNSTAVDWAEEETHYGYTLSLYKEIAAALSEPAPVTTESHAADVRLEPKPCTALAIRKPVIELPIDMLGYYKAGSPKVAIPGVVLHMTDALIVLRPPAEWAA